MCKLRLSRIINNELLVALYMVFFPSFSRFYNNNSRITLIYILITLVLAMLLKYKEGFYIKKSSMYVISCVMILFAISFIFNNNSMLETVRKSL